MTVKEFISKLKELGFNDNTNIEFELTDYENSYHYPELGIKEVNTVDQDIYDIDKPDILVSLVY